MQSTVSPPDDHQRSDGLFTAQVVRGGMTQADANLFVTALTVRELGRHGVHGAWHLRALDALERAAAERADGACAFWPAALQPTWAGKVPADVDDTAMVLTELYRHGRISRAAALRVAVRVLVPCRVGLEESGTLPPWVVHGCFRTWIDPAGQARANPVDCCVNANVAALFALLDVKHLPGYHAAIAAIEAGIKWAGRDPRRLDALTPFYPAPWLLLAALDHAIACGADELRHCARWLRGLPPGLLAGQPGLCRDAWGKCHWHAPWVAFTCAPAALLSA